MFHTLTLNPALDYLVAVDEFMPGKLNRAKDARLFAGGKGINVALMLRRLGQNVRALGFLAGDTGKILQGMLAAEGLAEAFVFLPAGMTRINLKLETPAVETELNGPGPAPDSAAMEQLAAQLNAIPAGDILVAAGSLPPGVSGEEYACLLAAPAARGVRLVLDASGEALRQGLSARPWLIKPNLAELAGLLGLTECEKAALEKEAADWAEGTAGKSRQRMDGSVLPPLLSQALRTVQGLGARNILVSLGRQGAALLCENGETVFQAAPQGRPVNTAGAGDSLLAGFLAGLARGENARTALRLGVAAGSATAFCPYLAETAEVEELLCGIGGY